MKEDKIYELKSQILEGKVTFLDTIVDLVKENKILYSDNFGPHDMNVKRDIEYLEPFMHLLYRGSKHSVGHMCESGFYRVVKHNDNYLKFTYYSGPETFVVVEIVDESHGAKRVVTLDLLSERLTEAEAVKNELAPIIEKYLKAGLTFEEITRMFVEIMRENRINL